MKRHKLVIMLALGAVFVLCCINITVVMDIEHTDHNPPVAALRRTFQSRRLQNATDRQQSTSAPNRITHTSKTGTQQRVTSQFKLNPSISTNNATNTLALKPASTRTSMLSAITHQENLTAALETTGNENESLLLLPNDATNTNTTINATKNLTHFVFHIPKTGATFAHATLVQLIRNHPKMKELPLDKQFQPCNQAKEPLKNFDTRYNEASKFNKIKCTSWMSEVVYSNRPTMGRYTILRNPKEHVVSQFFHCTESKTHAIHALRMPKRLATWLRVWASVFEKKKLRLASDNITADVEDPLRVYKDERSDKQDKRLMCYNPINLQSYMTQFNAKTQTEQDLLNRYHVIGDMAQMDKTICSIMIHMTDGWIPQECNCTTSARVTGSTMNQGDHFLMNGTATQQQKLNAYDPDSQNHAHGVLHHGASYNASKQEEELIEALTKYDQALYEMAKRVFSMQVSQLETKYHIQICDMFRTQS